MKVIIINQHISDVLGGSELQCDLIAAGLVSQGCDVTYFAVGPKRKVEYSNYTYTIIPVDLEDKSLVATLLDGEAPDIIYWRYNKILLYQCVKLFRSKSIPIIFAISAISDTRRFPQTSRIKILLRNKNIFKAIYNVSQLFYNSISNHRAFKFIDAVTANNSAYLNRLPVKKQELILNSIDRETGTYTFNKRPYCVWVANLKEKKRPELFIRLASEMKSSVDLEFVMVGNIQSSKYLKIIEDSRTLENFHFLGPLHPKEVNSLLRDALCLVHTCMPEGFGNNFIQAWGQGVPTISYEFDPDNLIQTENLGFVSQCDFLLMKEQLLELYRDPDLKEKYSNRLKEFVDVSFSQAGMVNKLLALMKSVIKSQYVNQNSLN